MSRILIDTSVLIKWVHTAGEGEVAEARALRSAHVASDLQAHIIDLAVYEMGNVLLRALKWPPSDVADQIDDLLTIVGPPLPLSLDLVRPAAALAHQHRLTFYDACWAATAQALDLPFVSADKALLAAGLAESPSVIVKRLRLSMS